MTYEGIEGIFGHREQMVSVRRRVFEYTNYYQMLQQFDRGLVRHDYAIFNQIINDTRDIHDGGFFIVFREEPLR